MEFHPRRLIDHVRLRVSDLEASKRFYRAVLRSLSTGPRSRPAERTTVLRGSVLTTPATTARTHVIRTGTTSRPSTTARRSALRLRSS